MMDRPHQRNRSRRSVCRLSPLVELAAYSPPEFFAGDGAADAVGAHESAVLVQRPGQGTRPTATDSLAMSSLAVVCPGVLPRWRGPDVGGPAPGAT